MSNNKISEEKKSGSTLRNTLLGWLFLIGSVLAIWGGCSLDYKYNILPKKAYSFYCRAQDTLQAGDFSGYIEDLHLAYTHKYPCLSELQTAINRQKLYSLQYDIVLRSDGGYDRVYRDSGVRQTMTKDGALIMPDGSLNYMAY